MQKLFHNRRYMLFLFFIFICIVSGTTFMLAPYGQTGVLLFILLLFVGAVGLFFGTIASLGVTLVLYFVIGSSYFWATLPASIVIQTEIPFFLLVIWMTGLLLTALFSGVCATRVTILFRQKELLEEQIRTVVATDPITGFDNASRLMFELEAEFSRSKRYSRTFSFLMFKMRNYDQFRQLYGEMEERRLLHHLSERIYAHTRKSDMRFRVDKDTFAIILTDTPFEHVHIVQEKIDEDIRTFRLRNNKLVTLTFDYGDSHFDDTLENYEDIFVDAKEQVDQNVS